MAKMKKCPWCEMMFEGKLNSCPYCHKKVTVLADGTLIIEGMISCPFCGKSNRPDSSCCSNCDRVMDGSDITLDKTPAGQKAGKLLRKTYLVLAVLLIPSIWVGFGWFLAVFFVAIAANVHAGTLPNSKNLKEASDSTFMLSLVFILLGGYLTFALWQIVLDDRAAKVDHYSQDQLLIFTTSVLLTGVVGALWASRQGIPNIWKFIKDLLAD